MKGLGDKNYTERICLISKSDDIIGVLHSAQRAAELSKKYDLVETYSDDNSQFMFFEQKNPL